MVAPIQVIQTEYAGHRFRSRREARWAVFFDGLGVEWRYENEGYDLGNGVRYLPDFHLPEHDYWIEIKGGEPTPLERDKARWMAQGMDAMAFIFHCDPNPDHVVEPYIAYGSPWCYAYFPEGVEDMPYHWAECPMCGEFEIQFEGRQERMACHVQGDCRSPDIGYNRTSPSLMNAYRRASRARFEHGESPVAPIRRDPHEFCLWSGDCQCT